MPRCFAAVAAGGRFRVGVKAANTKSATVSHRSDRLDPPPARLTGIDQRQINRRDSEQGDHRRLLRVALDAVVVGVRATRRTNPPAGTGTVRSGSKSAPLFTHHVPERTSERRSVA